MEPTPLNGGQPKAPAGEPIRLIGSSFVPGYLPGLCQACVVVEVVLAPRAGRQALEALDRLIAASLPASGPGALHPSVEAHGLLSRLVRGTLAVLQRAGMPERSRTAKVPLTSLLKRP